MAIVTKLTLFFLLLFLSQMAGGQDRIVTVSGDTIHGRILREGSGSVSLECYLGGVRSVSRIARREIRTIIRPGMVSEMTGGESAPGFLDFSFSGGPSYLVGSTDEAKSQVMKLGFTRAEADNYYRQLKLGWSASADVHLPVVSQLGAGVKYRFFTTSADEWATFDPQDGQNLYYGEMKETMYIHYAGPSVKSAVPAGRHRRMLISSALSAGWMFYRNEAHGLGSYYLVTGNSFGTSAETGLEYVLTRRIAIGMRFTLFASKMRKIEIDYGTGPSTLELPREQYENVSALDLLGGVRISL